MRVGVIIALIGGAQGLFLALTVMLIKRGSRQANLFLGLLIFTFSLYVLEFAGYWTEFFFDFPSLIFVTSSFPFLFGPFLYLFVITLSKERKLKAKQLIHFIPFLVYVGYMLPFYFSDAAIKLEEYTGTIRSSTPNFGSLYYVIELSKWLHLLLYVGAVMFYIADSTSFHKIQIQWLRLMLAGFGLYLLFDIFHAFQLYVFQYKNIHLIGNVFFILGAFLIYLFGYSIIQKPELLIGKVVKETVNKYGKSSLTKERAKEYRGKIIQRMEEDKFYLDSNLSLSSLASALGYSAHHVSQVLNDELGKNFFEFVNEYRIEEAKVRLKEKKYRHLSILGIANDVGFKNKTSFNSAFNKYVGTTPSQFRDVVEPG